MKIKLGFSTCPNDTFMFDAMVHGKVDTQGMEFEVVMADILHLNRMAMAGELDVVKVSYNTFGRILGDYALLDSGSAMGRGCGPLLVAREELSPKAVEAASIAIPGEFTTANMLLSFFAPEAKNRAEMLFHEVMPAVAEGRADAGLIIHENRFTYPQYGLVCVQDLGAHWEAKTGLPIPLGAIVARKSLGEARIRAVEEVLRDSVQFAFDQPGASQPFVRQHAQEMDAGVCQQHIELYVNEFSLSLGEEGRRAVLRLLKTGEDIGLYPLGRTEAFRKEQAERA